MGLLSKITKPFRKVLKSPIGKAALMLGIGHFGPTMFGQSAGMGNWGKAYGAFKKWPMWKQAATVGGITMGAGAVGDEVIDETETQIDTSGHEGYLNARKNFIDEWASWYMQQGDDEETAYAKARQAMFNDGGIVSLAQGGRIGLSDGNRHPHPGVRSQYSTPKSYGPQPGSHHPEGPKPVNIPQGERVPITVIPPKKPKITRDNTIHTPFYGPLITGINWVGDKISNSKFADWNNAMQRENYLENLQKTDLEAYAETLADLQALGYADTTTLPGTKTEFRDLEEPQAKEILEGGRKVNINPNDPNDYNLSTDYTDYLNRFNKPPGDGDGDGARAEWQRLGYPSYEAYLAAMRGGGGAPTDTTADYYGFSEWADWDPNNTAPLFGDATQYKALLNKGGRIGLYAGGMGGMNNPMNPMMNRGLGAMGSPGMNPFNQQNLMAQAQMRGNPMMGGNPMMAQRPGIAAQGPGISGTQAAAKMAKKEDDGELLKLIRMLASMGIPMEQLRGRTKEELVEMAISLQKDQPTGRPEVVEESEEVEEEVMTAANGGRIGYAGGTGEYGEPRPMGNPAVVEEIDNMREFIISNPGIEDVADYSKEYEEDEEEEYVDTRAGGGLMRTRYAMGSEQPIIPSKDGPQLDFRNTGGYQPHGKAEKHDDVRALLAQGEFVVTSDAVKGIGGGDRDLGAKRMYDMMHKYEPIGRALS